MREGAQLMFVAIAWFTSSPKIREENKFDFFAITEVAVLFIGIFVCMQVPVEILQARGGEMGLSSQPHFFWATGTLSSFLDNAPTYVVFFETAKALPAADDVTLIAGVAEHLLVAVSLGAVFMGAMTYIGNGPNFMVKSIAEQSSVKMPSFFGYMIYSVAVLVPVFVVMNLVFFVLLK
jgi:Na+/H+ antiporter NhaD/arsenite permease-like protein